MDRDILIKRHRPGARDRQARQQWRVTARARAHQRVDHHVACRRHHRQLVRHHRIGRDLRVARQRVRATRAAQLRTRAAGRDAARTADLQRVVHIGAIGRADRVTRPRRVPGAINIERLGRQRRIDANLPAQRRIHQHQIVRKRHQIGRARRVTHLYQPAALRAAKNDLAEPRPQSLQRTVLQIQPARRITAGAPDLDPQR